MKPERLAYYADCHERAFLATTYVAGGMTLKEAGELLGVGKERVSQMIAASMRRLRNAHLPPEYHVLSVAEKERVWAQMPPSLLVKSSPAELRAAGPDLINRLQLARLREARKAARLRRLAKKESDNAEA